jgi:small subunit ribosomal protein S6
VAQNHPVEDRIIGSQTFLRRIQSRRNSHARQSEYRGKPVERIVRKDSSDTVRNYEMMYILSPELGDENFPGAIERVNGFITRFGGELGEVNNSSPWGKRRLAYPIEKFTDGYYVVTTFKMEPAQAGELERELRLSEEVLRHLVISQDKK